MKKSGERVFDKGFAVPIMGFLIPFFGMKFWAALLA